MPNLTSSRNESDWIGLMNQKGVGTPDGTFFQLYWHSGSNDFFNSAPVLLLIRMTPRWWSNW